MGLLDRVNNAGKKEEEKEVVLKEQETASARKRVMTQGGTYEEEGSKTVSSTEKHSVQKEGKTKWVSPITILIGFVIVCLLVVGIMCIYRAGVKKRAAEEAKRAEELLQQEAEAVFEYTAEEKEQLRLCGFTGDEIENMEFEHQEASKVIEDMEKKRKEQYEKEIKPFFDGASDEFKDVYNNTWYGQKDFVVDSDVAGYAYFNENMNVDYEKLPPKGHQLYLKYYLSNGDACFMTVTPERYLELSDSGNIVISVEYTKMPNGKRVITRATEIIP